MTWIEGSADRARRRFCGLVATNGKCPELWVLENKANHGGGVEHMHIEWLCKAEKHPSTLDVGAIK